MSSLVARMRVAVIQLLVGAEKQTNIQRAREKVIEAHGNGAHLIILPECFNSPYGSAHFEQYAEPVPQGETSRVLAQTAADLKVWLVGGTIPETAEGRLYNTCAVFSPLGQLAQRYRKMHLFDIDIPGRITFKESETLSAGSSFATLSLASPWRAGLGICYDIRFPEFASVLTRSECNLLLFPGAFNTVTGPLHWHLLLRARAVDAQSYLIGASPARNPASAYQAYGHSLVVSPTGDIIAEAGEGEEIIYADLDIDVVRETRRNIPSLQQKRPDLYSLPEAREPRS